MNESNNFDAVDNIHSDSDSDSDYGDVNDHYHQLQEEEENEDYDYDDIFVDKLIPILQHKKEVPLRTRNRILRLAIEFLTKLEDDVHEMLCDNSTEAENYSGLDSDRDTEAEVETIIRFFPEVLSRRKAQIWVSSMFNDGDEFGEWVDADGEGDYPIHCLTYVSGLRTYPYNLKAVSFIPTLVRLAIEFSCFAVEERGGLFCDVLRLLLIAVKHPRLGEEHHQLFDDKYFQVWIQLRQQGHLKKEDIQDHQLLLNTISRNEYGDGFMEKRIRFLVEWDPTALLHFRLYDENSPLHLYDGDLPLHRAAIFCSIQGFRLVFDYGIHYYPIKKGINILFQTNRNGDTSIQLACKKFGRDKVMNVINDTLTRCRYSSDNDAPKLNIVEALVMAAIDKSIHLDCVYFLLRRQPDLLVKLLPLSSASASTTLVAAMEQKVETETETLDSNNNNNNNNNNKNNIGYDSEQRKRKRGGS